jgi:hypothetical protein
MTALQRSKEGINLSLLIQGSHTTLTWPIEVRIL